MTVPHKIIAELRRIRQQSRISQDAVAAAIGHDSRSRTICRLEAGRVGPLLTTVTDWAATLGYELVLRKK